MKNEQLAKEILRELVREAAQEIIGAEFDYWNAQYHGYKSHTGHSLLSVGIYKLDHLKGCFEEEEIKEIFDEARECCRAEVGSQAWALYENNAPPATPDQPDASVAEGVVF